MAHIQAYQLLAYVVRYQILYECRAMLRLAPSTGKGIAAGERKRDASNRERNRT